MRQERRISAEFSRSTPYVLSVALVSILLLVAGVALTANRTLGMRGSTDILSRFIIVPFSRNLRVDERDISLHGNEVQRKVLESNDTTEDDNYARSEVKGTEVSSDLIRFVLNKHDLPGMDDGEFEDTGVHDASYLVAEVVEKSQLLNEGEEAVDVSVAQESNLTYHQNDKVIVTNFMEKMDKQKLKGMDYLSSIAKDEEGPTVIQRAQPGTGHVIYVREIDERYRNNHKGIRDDSSAVELNQPRAHSSEQLEDETGAVWAIKKQSHRNVKPTKHVNFDEDRPAVRSFVRPRKAGAEQ